MCKYHSVRIKSRNLETTVGQPNISESGVHSARGFVLNHSYPGGSLQVEILDSKHGQPIVGFALNDSIPVKGDSVRHVMAWKLGGTDVSMLRGRAIQLRFVMVSIKLYTFQFTE